MDLDKFSLNFSFIGSTKHQVLYELKTISRYLNGLSYNYLVIRKKSKYTLLRGPFVHKKSREQFEYLRYSIKAAMHFNSSESVCAFLNNTDFKCLNFKFLKSVQLRTRSTKF
jgi:hypothetical protein